MLKIIACPSCKSAVQYQPQKNILSCIACRREYGIEDGIPVMLVTN